MKIYGSIEKTEKQADGTIMVYGFASSESVDVDGETIKADAIKNAIPDYMKFANVREMHDAKKAAGTVLEMEVQTDGRTFVKTHIVDAEAVKKVENKVYKGFSIGGKITSRDETDKTIIKGIRLSEISLVDRPANPDSVFTFCKVDDSAEGGDGAGAGVDATKPAADAPKPETDAAKPAEGDAAAGESAQEDEKKPDAPAEGAADADAAAGADADKEAADKTADLKKGMWAIGNLASILGSIQSLQQSAEWEAEVEGDNSTMPADIMAWLKTGGTLLSAMVTEEVAEMVQDDDVVVVEVLALADKAKGLMKAACAPAEAEAFAKGFDALVERRNDRLVKAGKRNSANDQKHIDAIHSASMALGASCAGTDKSTGKGDDLKKVASAMLEIGKAVGCEKDDDIVAKVTELVDAAETLAKRVKDLEAMPKPAKAVVKAVDKGGDVSNPEKSDNNKTDDAKDGRDALKKVWGSGGKVE